MSGTPERPARSGAVGSNPDLLDQTWTDLWTSWIASGPVSGPRPCTLAPVHRLVTLPTAGRRRDTKGGGRARNAACRRRGACLLVRDSLARRRAAGDRPAS